jgi:hypothetical protein
MIYLDTYVLQQDMRIRMPKSVITNLDAEKGKTKFDIYFNPTEKELILRIHEECAGGKKE